MGGWNPPGRDRTFCGANLPHKKTHKVQHDTDSVIVHYQLSIDNCQLLFPFRPAFFIFPAWCFAMPLVVALDFGNALTHGGVGN